jgi:hypothetical protein
MSNRNSTSPVLMMILVVGSFWIMAGSAVAWKIGFHPNLSKVIFIGSSMLFSISVVIAILKECLEKPNS